MCSGSSNYLDESRDFKVFVAPWELDFLPDAIEDDEVKKGSMELMVNPSPEEMEPGDAIAADVDIDEIEIVAGDLLAND